jgi:hypothetical protein
METKTSKGKEIKIPGPDHPIHKSFVRQVSLFLDSEGIS